MKSVIIKSALLIVLLLSISLAWQHIIDKGLRKSDEYGRLYKSWDNIYAGKANSDIIIMGSSRAAIHINPKLITDTFNKSCINLGLNGHKFLTQYYKYFIYEQHNKTPETIIVCLDILSLIYTKDFYEYEQFIPYLNDTLIRKIVAPQNFFVWKDFYIPMVKFTHRKDMVLDGTFSYFKSNNNHNQNDYKFVSVDKTWDTSFVRKALNIMYVDGFTAKIDSETNKLFLQFIMYCKEKKIKLIFVYPPEYIGNLHYCTNRKTVIDYYNKVITENNVPYFQYSNSPLASDTAYFFDSQHLNSKGVDLFDQQLIKDLKPLLQ